MSNTKIRLTITAVKEYEPDPHHYPEDKRTPEGMLEVDLSNANEDPFMLLDHMEMIVTGEVITKETT
jgi:hypothetical protein